MSAGRRRHYVRLDNQKTPTIFEPPTLFVELRPSPPSGIDEFRNSFEVDAPFHKQVTYDTILWYYDNVQQLDRQLVVRGIENIGELNREMRLYCEEVKTP